MKEQEDFHYNLHQVKVECPLCTSEHIILAAVFKDVGDTIGIVCPTFADIKKDIVLVVVKEVIGKSNPNN